MVNRPYIIRLYTLAFLAVVVWLSLIGRLVSIQLLNGKGYAQRAKDQHEEKIVLPGTRGKILDRNLRDLAVNLSVYESHTDPYGPAYSFAADPSRVKRPTWLARKLDWDTAEKIDPWNLTGVRGIAETKRCYPLGHTAAQLIGYTDVDNTGIEGVELAFNDYLKGDPGWMISEVDATGKGFPTVGNPCQHPEDGHNVVLTIDSRYQAIAEEELEAAVARFGAKAGTTIIMNPSTGEILAMASVPLYDPNHLDQYSPANRRNRAITDPFEPGSIFKIITASAALQEGLKKPEDRIVCENGRITVAGGVIHDWHKYGWLRFRDVIKYSSNIGTIKVAKAVGKKQLYKYINAFGFGTKTGVELPGEAEGIVRHPSQWSKRSLATIAIGQEISATCLQLANSYCAVANGGYLMRPQILKSVIRKDSQVVRKTEPELIRRVITEETAGTITDFLCGVVEEGTGTEAKIEGFSVAGKTGTAQKAETGSPGYTPDRFVSSFVGFLPAEDPQLLCLVVVDEPKGTRWGGQVAAPIFKRIVNRILNLSDCPIKCSVSQIDVGL